MLDFNEDIIDDIPTLHTGSIVDDEFKIGDSLGVPRTREEMDLATSTNYIIPAFRDGIITVDKLLDHVDVVLDWYIPSVNAIDFMNFIRLVLGEEPENSNPKAHYFLIDCIFREDNVKPFFDVRNIDYHGLNRRVLVLASREFSKSTLLGSMLILYIAAKGKLPGFGKVTYMLYVSDSMRNNVKTTMETIGSVYRESEYLRNLFEDARLVQDEVNFTRKPRTKKEIALYEEYVTKRGLKPEDVPGRMKRRFTMTGLGASALPLDTILYTLDGTTTIGDVRVGDKIFGNDGKLAAVTEKSQIFNEDVYKIYMSDGSSITVSDNHINNIYIKKDKKINGRREIVYEENNITTKELISKELFKEYDGRKKYKLYIKNIDPIQHSKKDFLIDPYLIGILLGDGHLSNDGSVRLEGLCDDVDFYISKIKNEYDYYRSQIDRPNRNKTCRIAIHNISDKIRELKLNGITGSDKFVPDEYFYGSIDQRLSLLRGLIDTDGQVKKTGIVRFDSISYKLVYAVQTLTRSLGGKAYSIQKYVRKKNNWQDIYSITISLQHLVPVSLPRKLMRIKKEKKYSPFKAIISIKKVPTIPTQCIAVNNDSRLFVASTNGNDYTVTHNTGGRGSREGLARPDGVFFDDLIGSEKDASSETILDSIESTIESDILPALSGNGNFALFAGTPYNKNDPAYRRIEEGSWLPIVFPKAEKIHENLTKEEFRGVWPDRHTYERCMSDFLVAKRASDNGNPLPLRKLNQEYYLRISSNEDRMINESFYQWFDRDNIIQNSWNYNWYITTDLTSTGNAGSDLSAVFLWAVNYNSDHFLVDMSLRKLELDSQYAQVFAMVSPLIGNTRGVEVGVEIDGQQNIHLTTLRDRMVKYNIYFTFASQRGAKKGTEGIRSRLEGGNKHWRFRLTLPMWQNHKIWFAKQLEDTPDMRELLEEIKYVTFSGFGSKYDDGCDAISQLVMMDITYPPKGEDYSPKKRIGVRPGGINAKIWGKQTEESDGTVYDSYA